MSGHLANRERYTPFINTNIVWHSLQILGAKNKGWKNTLGMRRFLNHMDNAVAI